HLGKETKHTVFEGELVGILLALQLVDKFPSAKTVLIALDNRSAITALQDTKPQLAQYLLDEIHAKIRLLRRRRRALRIHFEWAPGHKGIPGNTRADTLAKEAAEGKSSLRASLPALLHHRLPASTAALKAHRKKTINARWK
ncbi:hypothetical protein K439DRAFT_1279806, partial [Ramaria rubella]